MFKFFGYFHLENGMIGQVIQCEKLLLLMTELLNIGDLVSWVAFFELLKVQ